MKPSAIILSAAGFIIVALLSGNLFFVSRLIDKVERTEERVWELRQDIVVLQGAFDIITKRNKGD